MANIQFGTGSGVFIPSSANAALLANPTPQLPNLLQEMSVDFKADQKMLYGRQQFAAAVARGKITSSGKGKIATYDANFLNSVFFGMAAAVGGVRPYENESHAPGASVVVSTPGTGIEDRGVINADTGLQMLLVQSSPTIGQYTVATTTGTYTFNAAETASKVSISYGSASATKGTSIALTNQNMGYAPDFRFELYNTFRSKLFALTLNRCTMTDFSIPTKQDDFWTSDFSFSISADDAGNVGTIYAD